MEPCLNLKIFRETQKLIPFLFSGILMISCLFGTQLAAQSNSVWTLNPAMPHAKSAASSYYPITFSVLRLDSKGGHIQARASKPGQPECFALFDYDWTFSSALDVVHQGDVFEVKIALTAYPALTAPRRLIR